jgi:DNA modification methylase
VDTILTSPPYGHEATASKPTKLEMEGLFKMGHSKETPLTDEDYRAWELRNKGNIAKRKLFVRVPCKPEEAQFHDTRKGRKGTIWEWTKEVKVDLNNINVQQQKNEEKGKTETYLEAMFKVYNECYQILKPKGLMIIVLKNFIRNWRVVDLIGDTVKLCEHIGFKLVKRIKFKLPNVSFWRINYAKQYEKKTGKPFPVKEFESVYLYETVLVFQKI